MIKTVKFGNKDVELDNNIGWTMIYRDQFGQDIVPAIMPILAGMVDVASGLITEADVKEEITFDNLAKVAESGKLEEALIKVASAEFVDFLNIAWSLAKNADDSIPEPRIWVRQFDEFPVDVIGPEIFKLVFCGMVSSKNQKRLNAIKKNVQPKKNPSTSTQ